VDHPRLWVADGKAVLYTSEPYHVLAEARKGIHALAEHLGQEQEAQDARRTRQMGPEVILPYVILEPDPVTSLWNPDSTWFVAIARVGFEGLLPRPRSSRREAILAQKARRDVTVFREQ
jgi:hypothetical protein